jgi:hypothetical protein
LGGISGTSNASTTIVGCGSLGGGASLFAAALLVCAALSLAQSAESKYLRETRRRSVSAGASRVRSAG